MNTKTIVGTEVYLDLEYSEKGKLKNESDIYSLGVVLFELLSGRVAYDQIYVAESTKGHAEVTRKRFNEGALKNIIDPELVEEVDDNLSGLKIGANQESLEVFANIAIRCLEITQDKRPTMKVVIEGLQNALNLQSRITGKNATQFEHI
ncbi:probable serine/threonine-protein kinase PBL28 [Rutidosis leptorrhynchoides]|uniref:probable serine/threonine-protein kinase PBL28 n=1 Tax=Rutidosis leptorrhynchoides TaxID=125765 RepID=UPI003A99C5D8